MGEQRYELLSSLNKLRNDPSFSLSAHTLKNDFVKRIKVKIDSLTRDMSTYACTCIVHNNNNLRGTSALFTPR